MSSVNGSASVEETVLDELETLASQVDTLTTNVSQLTGLVERHVTGAARPGPGAASGPAADGGEVPELYFADVEAFVGGFFLPMFGWRVDGQRWHWCRSWWDHAEVIWRLETLWRSWEAYRMQPTGMSSWRLELDGQLPYLMGPDSPMAGCVSGEDGRAERHQLVAVPVNKPAPDGWWDV